MGASTARGNLIRRVVIVAVLIAACAAGLGVAARYQVDAKQGSCGDWVNETSERIGLARQLLAPAERQEQSTGSVQGDAQALYDLAIEQSDSSPPDLAYYLNGDLVEAMATGSQALNGAAGGSAEAQIGFAKAIVYNADLRLNAVADAC